ncbi:MAG: response regulator transcription factor [Ginsengibacter sp.]
MTQNPIRLIIADDHEIFRDGVITMLNKYEDIKVIAEATNGEQLVQLARKHLPDVILADIQMPVMDGIEATRIIREKFPAISIIALSMMDNAYMITDMQDAGANGYLLKSALKAEIIAGIRAVSKNREYFCSGSSQKLAAALSVNSCTSGSSGKKPVKGLRFSQKEKEIIGLICDGLSTTEISKKLFLSASTIENYRSSLHQKTGCKNAAEFGFYISENKLYLFGGLKDQG